MDKIDVIMQPVQKEMEAFDELFKQSLHSRISDFQYLLDFISSKQGKKIRPLILLLSAKLCGEPTQKTLDYAVILELLHTATLIHDDIIDSTMERRGQPSVNAKYDNKIAVLLGDYILSLAIINGVSTENLRILKILSNLAQELVEGELIQLISSSDVFPEEDRYFEIIRKKTAVLLFSCAEMGAISVNASENKIETLRLIGENLGICFQIKDDLFDYFEQGEIGKPTGNDIREGKITLPLLHALKNAPKEKSETMRELIKNRDFSQENILQLISFAKEYKGIEYAQNKMQEIKQSILSLLSVFPDSASKQSMIALIDYIIERRK
ncbi:polyprenyl synthetase family protein [Bacteroidales bacterium OttesenSCG-928-M06]|nr:polyprenyl synthetase family protein [Bacteroidales bacterium OttesenSCG-928-M06]